MRITNPLTISAIVLIAFGLASPILAQGDLPSEKIEVIKAFDARLIEAQKVSFQPQALATDTTQRQYEYVVSAKVPEIEYLEPTIKPLALQSIRKPQVYRGFARAGYGVPNFILGNASYQLVQNENLQLGAFLKHNSANNKDIPHQRYMDNDAGLRGTWYSSPALAVDGDISYSLDDYYYYAEDPNEPNPDFNKRRYKTFKGAFGIRNIESLTSGFGYHANVEYINHQDDQGTAENDIKVTAGGTKAVGVKHFFALDVTADFTALNDIMKRSLNNYTAAPSFTFRADKFKLKGGVTAAYDSDKFYFYPIFQASVKVWEDKIVAFAGAEGGLHKNNFYNLSNYNPYISVRIDSIQNTRNTSFSLGANGKYRFLEYSLKVSYGINRNLALYLNDQDDARTFQPVYDDVNIWTVEGMVRATPLPKLETGLSIAKMFYSTTEMAEAWHLPGLEGRAFANYLMFDDKLRLRLDFFMQSGIHYIKDDKSTSTLKPTYDVSVGADWFFTEKFGIFANLNNLTSNKGVRWNRYPTYGFNAVGGLIVRF